jgi:hypothetical protein
MDAAKLADENDLSSFWIVGYLVILNHALIHKYDKQNTNTSIMQATTSYLLLLIMHNRKALYLLLLPTQLIVHNRTAAAIIIRSTNRGGFGLYPSVVLPVPADSEPPPLPSLPPSPVAMLSPAPVLVSTILQSPTAASTTEDSLVAGTRADSLVTGTRAVAPGKRSPKT